MGIEWVKETPRQEITVKLPAHWVDFLQEEARFMNQKTGTKKYSPSTVIYEAVKRFAYVRGFVQVGSTRGGVVVRRDDGEGEEP